MRMFMRVKRKKLVVQASVTASAVREALLQVGPMPAAEAAVEAGA
jgi:hypothetical protein